MTFLVFIQYNFIVIINNRFFILIVPECLVRSKWCRYTILWLWLNLMFTRPSARCAAGYKTNRFFVLVCWSRRSQNIVKTVVSGLSLFCIYLIHYSAHRIRKRSIELYQNLRDHLPAVCQQKDNVIDLTEGKCQKIYKTDQATQSCCLRGVVADWTLVRKIRRWRQ